MSGLMLPQQSQQAAVIIDPTTGQPTLLPPSQPAQFIDQSHLYGQQQQQQQQQQQIQVSARGKIM
jgi:hypothetical protein